MFNLPNYSGYTPWYNNQPQAQAQSQSKQQGNIIWVQGEAGAKSYPVAPNSFVQLMDSENNVFYIKSADESGMPKPLRVFDFTERVTKPETQTTADYVTREEFEKRLAELSNGQ